MLSTALMTATLALAGAPVAIADSTESSNWAGYAVHGPHVSFRRVFATWRQPTASCQVGHPRYSAMWVGLGGYRAGASALEQVGTELDCSRAGRMLSSAWYELVPAASRPIRLTVRPGDLVRASVTVVGARVTAVLYDVTRHRGFRRTLSTSVLDVSSAEWIVEAPSDCSSQRACATLPLANFGSAAFGGARAQSTRGHAGSISDAAWRSTKIKLTATGSRYVANADPGSAGASATPAALQAKGTSFSVTYSGGSAAAVPTGASRRAIYLVHTGR
jgi:hypothetical protein